MWNDYSRMFAAKKGGGGSLERSTTDFGENQHVLKDYVSLRGCVALACFVLFCFAVCLLYLDVAT